MPASVLGLASFAAAYLVSMCISFPAAYFIMKRRWPNRDTEKQEEAQPLSPPVAGKESPLEAAAKAAVVAQGVPVPLKDAPCTDGVGSKDAPCSQSVVDANGWEEFTGLEMEDAVDVLARCFPPNQSHAKVMLVGPAEELRLGDSTVSCEVDANGQKIVRKWVRNGTSSSPSNERVWKRKPTEVGEQVAPTPAKKSVKRAKSKGKASRATAAGRKPDELDEMDDEELFAGALRQFDKALEAIRAPDTSAPVWRGKKSAGASEAAGQSDSDAGTIPPAKASSKKTSKSGGVKSGNSSRSEKERTLSAGDSKAARKPSARPKKSSAAGAASPTKVSTGSKPLKMSVKRSKNSTGTGDGGGDASGPAPSADQERSGERTAEREPSSESIATGRATRSPGDGGGDASGPAPSLELESSGEKTAEREPSGETVATGPTEDTSTTPPKEE